MNSERARRVLTGRNAALSVFAYIILSVSTAHAGHEPLVPEPRTILLRDGHPEHVVVGTRRGGYFVTRDAGSTWSWMCEAGVGYEDEEVYPGALLGSGKLVVSTGFGGLAVSPDGCGWLPWLPSAQPFVADVRLRPDAEDVVIALEGRGEGASFVNQLWQSTDDAETWQPLGAAFAPDTQAVSFAVSDTGELYVATTGPTGAELLRSDDSAVSWTRTTITPELGITPRVIGAHEGSGSPHVYVVVDYAQADGLTTPGDRALMSLDGGETFLPLLEGVDDLSSWSLTRDGQRLIVGGHNDGIHLLTDAGNANDGAQMTRVSSLGVHALAWGPDGRLYAAGHEAIDGFSVGVSEDDGLTFSALFALCQVNGPLACPAETTVGALCLSSGETGWDARKEVAANDACAEGSTPGAGGASSLPPEDHPHSPTPGAGQPASSSGETTSDAASSCSAARSRGTSGAALLLALAAFMAVLRRLSVAVM